MTTLPPDINKRVDRITQEFDAILADPQTLKDAEEFHQTVSTLTIEDLIERFTI